MNTAFAPPTELWQGSMDEQQLGQYQLDLEQHAEILGIQAKRTPRAMVDHQDGIKLAAAMRGLLAGEFRAIQLCYSYDNRVWCDTLLRQAKSFTLIRTY
jgi:hypothetical protein